MKKIFGICLAAVLLLNLSANAQQVKIAYINSQDLLEAMPEAKAANDKLIAYVREMDSVGQTYVMEYQRIVGELQNNPNLSEIAREAKIQDAMDLEERIQKYDASSQDKIDTKKRELFDPIIKSATEIVKTVAKENGYTHVIDNSLGVLIMAPEGDDILPLVKKKLNIQ